MRASQFLVISLLTGTSLIGACNTPRPTSSTVHGTLASANTSNEAASAAALNIPDIIPAPPAAFGAWPMNTKSQPLTFALVRPGSNQNQFFEIRSIQLGSGGSHFTTDAVPGQVQPGAAYRFNVFFSPAVDGPFNDTLIIKGLLNDATFSSSIPLSGVGLCTSISTACDPIGPLCLVDRNSESYDLINIDPGPTITNAISRQFIVHNQPGVEYTMPPSHIWQLMGLYDRLTEIPGDQCSNFRFSHHANSRAKADVYWDFTSDLIYRGSIKEEGVIFTLTLPKQLRAVANVSNAYTEFFFRDPSNSPTIEVALEADPSHPIRKHAIKCISATAFFSTLRSHGGEVPIYVGLEN